MKTKQTCKISELKHNEIFFFQSKPDEEYTHLTYEDICYLYCPKTAEFYDVEDYKHVEVLHWVEELKVSDLQVGDLFSCEATRRTETLRLVYALVTYHNIDAYDYKYQDCYIAESLDKTHVFRLRGKEKVERK